MFGPFAGTRCRRVAYLYRTARFSRLEHPPVQRQDFDQSLQQSEAPPAGASLPVTALWWVCKRNWQTAHDLIDQAPGLDEAWVHAFLHRMEGDQGNADYWYRRAGKVRPNETIGKELEQLLNHFLN